MMKKNLLDWKLEWINIESFTSQCRKMVRYTLEILQQMLQDF